jgi:hypothetical protein
MHTHDFYPSATQETEANAMHDAVFGLLFTKLRIIKTDKSKTRTPEMAGNNGTDYFARFVF